ncbi:hypothetical protein [Methylophilus sp. 14]|uniref:DUF6988 family protein n=1 Tax=Methylophilus sp. 14 TaxID=2781019 RepID=UPI00188EF8F2|nr:hypothetical protein [Methylophilus sp. 14]MBF4988137.1 hypothetical protein [Methylophilus sp. 14]
MSDSHVHLILERSEQLDSEIISRFTPYKSTNNKDQITQICSDLSFQHAKSLRVLYDLELDGTATAILRMQFESVVRLMWLHFSAPDSFIQSYSGSISVDNPPKDFPTITKMLEKIKRSGVKGPGETLEEFKEVAWRGMNNHIHNGYLALSRHVNSYPEKLVIQIVRNSNALNLMTAMVLARIEQSQDDVSFVKNLQLSYQDIMPELRFN